MLGGIDPETKSYVGATPLLKKQLAALQADKAMPAHKVGRLWKFQATEVDAWVRGGGAGGK